MISDVLFEAIVEIEGYQERMPDCYDEVEPELENVITLMNAMREALDTPPDPPTDTHADAVLKAIRQLDLSEIRKLVVRKDAA